MRTLTIPCADPEAAAEFIKLLDDEGITVAGWVGHFVQMSWDGNPGFPGRIAELAFSNGYAYESEVRFALRADLTEALAS